MPPQCTWSGAAVQQWLPLHLFQLGIALDKFFSASTGETHRDAPVLIVAFDADDGANSIVGMANFLAEKWIGIGTASYGRPHVCGRTSRTAGRRRRNRLPTHATQEFLGRVRILRVRFIAPRLPDLGHRAAHCFHEFAWNFRKEPR